MSTTDNIGAAATTHDVAQTPDELAPVAALGILDEYVQLRISEYRRKHGKIAAAGLAAVVGILQDDQATQLDPIQALRLGEVIVPAVLAATRRSRSGVVES